jgi:hypothetical protein
MGTHNDGVRDHQQAAICRERTMAIEATEWLITMGGGVVE